MMNRQCVAFKMNYCNGGATSERVGFNGICDDENIFYNINVAKRRWCSNDRCQCKKYLDGKNFRRNEFVCYESTLLKDWRVEVGENFDGKPRKIIGDVTNHLCVLTTKYPRAAEAERFVFAMFIVKKIFIGDDEHAGFVEADDVWRLEFRPHEAAQMKFWDVYQNPNAPQKKFWGTGLFRYFDDATAVKFLERAAEVKRNDFTRQFLQRYARLALTGDKR